MSLSKAAEYNEIFETSWENINRVLYRKGVETSLPLKMDHSLKKSDLTLHALLLSKKVGVGGGGEGGGGGG